MPRGDKRRYTDKQKRQAAHIEEGFKERGMSSKQAAARAWATVNAVHGGGEKPGGSGYGKPENHEPMRKGGRKGGRKTGGRKRSSATTRTRTATTTTRKRSSTTTRKRASTTTRKRTAATPRKRAASKTTRKRATATRKRTTTRKRTSK